MTPTTRSRPTADYALLIDHRYYHPSRRNACRTGLSPISAAEVTGAALTVETTLQYALGLLRVATLKEPTRAEAPYVTAPDPHIDGPKWWL